MSASMAGSSFRKHRRDLWPSELLSEDFQHDGLYGAVRAVNPFL